MISVWPFRFWRNNNPDTTKIIFIAILIILITLMIL